MNDVYILKCVKTLRSAHDDLLDIVEITTGVYETSELAIKDGEKFVQKGEFEAYSVSCWRVIKEGK